MGHVIDVSHLLLYSPLSQPAFHSLFIPISKLLFRRNLCNLRLPHTASEPYCSRIAQTVMTQFSTNPKTPAGAVEFRSTVLREFWFCIRFLFQPKSYLIQYPVPAWHLQPSRSLRCLRLQHSCPLRRSVLQHRLPLRRCLP